MILSSALMQAQPAGLYADGWGRGPSTCGFQCHRTCKPEVMQCSSVMQCKLSIFAARCIATGMDGLRVGSEECDDCNAQACHPTDVDSLCQICLRI